MVGIIRNLYDLYIYISQISCHNLNNTAFVMQSYERLNEDMSACAAQLYHLLRFMIKCDATSLQLFASVLFISPQTASKLEFIYCPNSHGLNSG